MIAYGSRQLKTHELNYPTHDLELAAVIFALKSWRHYLLGEKFVVFTDHKSLQYIYSQRDLNMRQRRWVEYLDLFQCELAYTPGKGNVVADALSRKNRVDATFCFLQEWRMMGQLAAFALHPMSYGGMTVLGTLVATPVLHTKVIEAQEEDDACKQWVQEIVANEMSQDWTHQQGKGLRYMSRLVVPAQVREEVMREFHSSRLAVHPGATKMYHAVRQQFWWTGMKGDILDFVGKCLTCQQVKAEHQRPGGLLQPLPVAEWKWDHITMDFVTGLPRTARQRDTIWVIVDRLTKSAHFLPIREKDPVKDLGRLYVNEIVRLHGIPVSIVSDRDARFTSRFWQSLQECLGTRVSLSTAFHPQTDGQSERTIQTLEDMLRACALELGKNWESHLPLVEFAYNNSYQASIKMAPFEALYGRPCRSPLCWNELGDAPDVGPDLVRETTDKIQMIRQQLLTAQSRQKSYADKRRRPLKFEVGDHVFLKISP